MCIQNQSPYELGSSTFSKQLTVHRSSLEKLTQAYLDQQRNAIMRPMTAIRHEQMITTRQYTVRFRATENYPSRPENSPSKYTSLILPSEWLISVPSGVISVRLSEVALSTKVISVN